MQSDIPHYDALIIGAGPAGVSCAIWLARLGFAPLVIEAGAQVGGLCRSNPFPDDWNATLPGQAGPQVADQLERSLELARAPVRLACAVAGIQRTGAGFQLQLADGGTPVAGRYVVLATGVAARGLPATAPGILTGPGQEIVQQDFRDKRVAVLGGGDNAFENALYATDHGAQQVDVFARNIRAQQQFVDKFPAQRVRQGDYVVDVAQRTVNGVSYDLILVFYGWEPCIGFAASLGLGLTDEGFVATVPATAETSVADVFAIGEVAQRMHPCVVTALADGVTAAKAIQARIEAGRKREHA